MADYQHLILNREGGIVFLSINHPETLNALSSDLLGELRQVVAELEIDSSVHVLVITGSGRAFVAGADIKEMSQMTPMQAKAYAINGSGVFRQIEMLPFPVIAAINGFALGGGCELAMACDIRIASNKAKFGQPEVGLGIPPGFSGTQRMSRLIGEPKAKELIYTADVIDAEEALSIGLVNKVVAPEELLDAARQMAEKIASKSRSAIMAAKEAINKGGQTDIDTAITIEQNLFAHTFAHPDQKEGMTAFLEKRKPNFE
ncbi:hypothetical protein HQ45_09505 [Porphyromonas crevioricanis]|uniref:enoyl-CoA hydratase-related protein n=1 Tax=Porphyromonas crevioricanis TaxID=393921 RepID=UPI00052BD328|nr:enoyl-CoA hydratase-related protein [Porphyromonas crevioricanis]KGN88890.1 hypothetical protein HQ45_09505 [Porphyromonas crevioricanis]